MSPPIVWSFEPSVLVGTFALTWGYVWAWRRAREPGQPHPPGYGRLTLFAGSMLTVLAALVSPLDALSRDLMVMHMVQHMLLLDVMPILLILSLTKGILRPVTPYLSKLERRAGGLAHPAFAVVMYIGVLAFWHLPKMYDLALEHSTIHAIEHLCFSAAGTLYWWHLISPIRSRMQLPGMGQIVYMSVAKLGVGMLGIILAFSTHAFYPWYEDHPLYWGLSARTDQNLAGVVMALEQSIVMGIALVYIVYRMFEESEREAQRRERFEIA